MKLPAFAPALSAFYKNLSRKEKLLLYGTAAIVSGLFMDAVIIRPVARRLEALSKQTQTLRTQALADRTLLEHEDAIQKQRAAYGSYLAVSQNDNEEFAAILKEVETEGGKAGINVLDIKPSGVRQTGPVKRYTVTVACEGSMEKLAEFMYRIETAPQLLVVVKYEFAPKSKDTDLISATLAVAKLTF